MFDEVAAAGYGGLELGPYGYVPLDLDAVSDALSRRGLFIVAGTIFDDLVAPRTARTCCARPTRSARSSRGCRSRRRSRASAHATPYLTVMDWGHDERDYAAGHSDRAPRLSDAAWAGMVANIRAIAELRAKRHGVRAVIHPHAGGYIEFADEIERIAPDVPAARGGLLPRHRPLLLCRHGPGGDAGDSMPTGSTTSTSRTSTGRCSTA